MRGSYTWSHYYGNFDQDSSAVGNDDNVFIGSSNIADGAGRQLWNNRYGDLRGDRRHLLKIYGYHALPWNATAGLYGVAQSGQPWETWSYEPYRAFTTNTSDTARNTEPAGSRVTAPHWQVDLNYTQNVRFGGRYNFQIVGDLFNVGEPPDRLQLRSPIPHLHVQHASEPLRSATVPAGASVPVLIELRRAEKLSTENAPCSLLAVGQEHHREERSNGGREEPRSQENSEPGVLARRPQVGAGAAGSAGISRVPPFPGLVSSCLTGLSCRAARGASTKRC